MSHTIDMMATIGKRGSTSHEQYNMDNPVNLNECPRVEFWTDTKWEPYNEDIQQTIRRHLATYREDFI